MHLFCVIIALVQPCSHSFPLHLRCWELGIFSCEWEMLFRDLSCSLVGFLLPQRGLKALNNLTAFAIAPPEGPDDQLCAAATFSARSKFRVIWCICDASMLPEWCWLQKSECAFSHKGELFWSILAVLLWSDHPPHFCLCSSICGNCHQLHSISSMIIHQFQPGPFS